MPRRARADRWIVASLVAAMLLAAGVTLADRMGSSPAARDAGEGGRVGASLSTTATPGALSIADATPSGSSEDAVREAGADATQPSAGPGAAQLPASPPQRPAWADVSPSPAGPRDDAPATPATPAPKPPADESGGEVALTVLSGDMRDLLSFEPAEGAASYRVWRMGATGEELVATLRAGETSAAIAVSTPGPASYAIEARTRSGARARSPYVDNSEVRIESLAGPEGGQVRSSNGEVYVTFPEGSLPGTTTVTVAEADGGPGQGFLRLAGVYDIGLGAPLSAPATLGVKTALAVTQFQIAGRLLAAAELMTQDAAGAWVAGANETTLTAEGYLQGSVDHFSYWTGATVQPHGTTPEKTDYCTGVCHDLQTSEGMKIAARSSTTCYFCHGNASASNPPAGATGANVQAAFYACEGQSRPGAASTHPVEDGDLYCTSCHDPHKDPGQNPGLLRSFDAVTGKPVTSGEAYCWTCHGVVANRAIDRLVPGYFARAGGDKKTYLLGSAHQSLPTTSASQATCSACHASHGSPSSALVLVGEVASATVTGNDQSLCRACHVEAIGAYQGSAVYGTTLHSTVMSSEKAATTWSTSASAAGSCQNCHDPHGSANGDFLRVTGAQLCVGCHDVAGAAYPADYSYRGGAAFDASGHDGISRSVGFISVGPSSTGFAAWESATLPTPSSPGTPMSAERAMRVESEDGTRVVTALQTATGDHDYQMYRFAVPAEAADVVTATLSWSGYGEETAGYPVSLYLWRPATGTWEQVVSRVMAGQQSVLVPVRAADHVDAGGYVYVLASARYVYDGQLVSGPTFTVLSDTSVRVDWVTAGNTTSWVDYGLTTAYGATAGSSTRTTNHSVTIGSLTTGVWHFRVRSASPSGEDYVSGDWAHGFPRPKLASPYPPDQTWMGTPLSASFYWESLSAAEGPVEYRLQLFQGYNGGTLHLTTPWQASTSYSYANLNAPGYWSWRVEARDANGVTFGWSVFDNFYFSDGLSGSCPFLFTWDGERFAFEADLYGPGKLALKTKNGYMKPTPDDVYLLSSTPAAVDGELDLRLVEERFETDYLDKLALYAIDVPDGLDVFAEKREAGGAAFGGVQSVLHTVGDLKPPVSAIHVQTGADVSDAIAEDDERYHVLNEDRNAGFTYQTIELDLGDVADAPQLKVVMDAMSMFPTTPEGAAHAATFGPRTKLEVQDAAGAWVAVPSSAGALPKPPEFSRPYVFDLTDVWVSESRKVRFTFLFKTYLDHIAIDTTQDVPVTLTMLPLASAELGERGYDPMSSEEEIYEYVYGEPSGRTSYFPGAYTRLGEVSPLLAATDDRFVIYGGGDELRLRFGAPAPPAEGTTRRYAIHTNGYYKDTKTDVAPTVEPLPFAEMSTFPYGEDESYPDDDAHQAYRAEWNTRLKGDITAESAQGAVIAGDGDHQSLAEKILVLADARTARLTEAAAGVVVGPSDYAAGHRSLNTDQISLEVAVADGAAEDGECLVCHAVHGTAEGGELLSGGRVASDGRTCLAEGTGGCHDSAANSASGVDIRTRFTVNADPRAHHDVLRADQLASGGKTTCADCHNPHTNTAVEKYADPDDVAVALSTNLRTAVGEDGSLYMLVGAQHDGAAPLISGIALTAIGSNYASPRITWTTNEAATSWIDWGLTTSYELGNESAGAPFGNTSLVTAHAVQMSGLTPGVTYHYRVRTTDALGNTAYSADRTYKPVAPPPAPVPSDTTTVSGTGWGPISATVGCSPVSSSDGHAVQYEFRIDGNGALSSGWTSSTSYTTPAWLYTGTHYVEVRARDAVDTDAISEWSSRDYFVVQYADEWSGSCPFLFTWDGERFAFEADLYGPGKLALKTKNGYMKPTPDDVYLLSSTPAAVDGELDLRLVEERFETDYLDKLALYAIDVPDGLDVFAEKREAGGAAFGGVQSVLHTVGDLKPPVSAIHVQTGADVSDAIAEDDERYHVLNEDRNAGFTYQTIELDLGDVADAPQLKVVMDAMSMFPTTPEGAAHAATFGPRTKLEVQDAAGAWVAVPSSAGALPKPPEFSRPYVFDLTDVWVSESRKVRFTFLFKTYLDHIAIDTTQDVPVTLTMLPLASAELGERGYDPMSSEEEIYEYVYGEPSGRTSYFPGAYTRLGEVSPLLAATDDRFVIYGGGDELRLRFGAPAPPAEGTTRRYAIHTNGYYKDTKTDVAPTVEPLPFAEMSTFPYGEDESYPDDDAHQAYRAEWNTRLKGDITAESAQGAVIAVWRTSHAGLSTPEPGLTYSVDSDYLRLKTLSAANVTAELAPAAGWESASSAGAKPTPAAPGTAVSAATLGSLDVETGRIGAPT
ncbi:MAG: cytochrome c3 family protein [Anaerosomatales bacterium]|nr:cytochrome c3 family protein [Anaerosomatales bacterium]